MKAGEISKSALLLNDIDAASLGGADLDLLNHLILATGLYGADTLDEARGLCRTLPFDFAPALRHRFALKKRDPRLAKALRAHGAHAAAHGADFGWSTALRCLWDGKTSLGLARYRHRHGARFFGRFVPEGAVYRPLGDPAADDPMFIEQGGATPF